MAKGRMRAFLQCMESLRNHAGRCSGDHGLVAPSICGRIVRPRGTPPQYGTSRTQGLFHKAHLCYAACQVESTGFLCKVSESSKSSTQEAATTASFGVFNPFDVKYQSTARRTPSWMPTRGRQPSTSFALAVLNCTGRPMR